jgi:hypothetical protein
MKALLLALALGGCSFGMAQMTPEQLEAMAKDRNASVACFDGTYAGAKVKMLFISADKGVPAGTTIRADCEVQFMSGSATVPKPVQ